MFHTQFHRRMRDALICLVNTACKLQSLDDEEDDDDSGGLGSVCVKFVLTVNCIV